MEKDSIAFINYKINLSIQLELCSITRADS